MKTLHKFLILSFCLFFLQPAIGQDITGIITYEGNLNLRYRDSFIKDLNQKEMPMHVKQGVADLYNNSQPIELILNFNKDESYYYHNTALEKDGAYNLNLAASMPYYTNTSRDWIIQISPSLGNIAHSSLEWSVTSESKKIGKYTCYKAVAPQTIYSRTGPAFNKEVVAWFAPEIPLNFGPREFKGLPGLILEVVRDDFTISAKSITLNPEKGVKIKSLDKDAKIISQEKSHEMVKELEAERKRG